MTTISGFHVMWVPGFSEERDDNVIALGAVLTQKAPVHVYRDKLRQGVLFNYRRMMTAIAAELEETGADWAIGMQDDAIPVYGWKFHLLPALEHAPAPIVSLCHFADHGKKLYDRGFAYATHVHAVWGQAVAYHRDVVPQLLEVINDVFEMDPVRFKKWDDGLAAVHNLIYGGESCFTTLAIFDHMKGASTLGHLKDRGPSATIANHEPLNWATAPVTKFPSGKVKPLIVERTEELKAWRAAR